jgi:hypothetical protein
MVIVPTEDHTTTAAAAGHKHLLFLFAPSMREEQGMEGAIRLQRRERER